MSNEHSPHHAAHGFHTVKDLYEGLPALPHRKSPVVAGLLGFLFGGIGLGLYFRTWKDGVFPILAFAMLSMICPWGLGEFAGAVFACIWGVVRAADSNTRRLPTASATDV
jgi:hypothetical protein